MELELAAGGLGKYSFILLSVIPVGCPSPATPGASLEGLYSHSRVLAVLCKGTAPSFRDGRGTIPSLGSELLRIHLPSALGMHGRKGRSNGLG